MPGVELVYDPDCPNVQRARKALLESFNEARLEPSWTEWDRTSSESPAYARRYGSPTILVDGRDVAGGAPGSEGASCRVYRNDAGRFSGAPSVDQIAAAFRAGGLPAIAATGGASGWRSSLGTVPGIAVAFLPKLACPACWPAYAGLLSSVGLGFLADTAYLFPLTAAFLILTVATLGFRARARRGYGPCGVGLAGALSVLVGKFLFDASAAWYGGIGMLMAASLWNTWRQQREEVGSCSRCVQRSRHIDTQNASSARL